MLDSNQLFLMLAGFDEQAEAIITGRLSVLNKHLDIWSLEEETGIPILSEGSNSNTSREATLLKILRVASLGGDDPLAALADELDIGADVEECLVRICHKRGLFDHPNSRLPPPKIDDLLPKIGAILGNSPYESHRAAELVQQAICSDYQKAKAVAREFTKRLPYSIKRRVFAILQVYHDLGPVGLLHLSDHPCADILIALERQFRHEPPELLSILRADLLALYYGLIEIDRKLWQSHLLYEPPSTANRQRYAQRLSQSQRTDITAAFARHRRCFEEEAKQVFERFVSQGLVGLESFRSTLLMDSRSSDMLTKRALRALDRHTKGVQPESRHLIEHMLRCLLKAIEATGVSFSIVPLITDQPSSNHRRRLGRRISFGLPSLIQQRQNRQVHQRKKKVSQTTIPYQADAASTMRQSDENNLVSTFAVDAHLDEQEAKNYLRDFITYGVLGLLPKEQRALCIDRRLLSLLQLTKFGHIPGTVQWPHVMQVVASYCSSLAIDVPSSQLLRAIYNSVSVPSYWHGGKGHATEHVSHQGSIQIESHPRLHAIWMLIPIKLNLNTLVDGEQYKTANPLHILLVVDQNSQLPMGCWISTSEPGLHEVCLAIYQAIWHPGTALWPIHGIPEVLQIPASLVNQPEESLNLAAHVLMTKAEKVDSISLSGLGSIQKLVKDFKSEARAIIGRQFPSTTNLASSLLQQLLSWLRTYAFRYHRTAEVPLSFRQHGVAMPGHDTPAAGWLLPVINEVIVEQGEALVSGQIYTNASLRQYISIQGSLRAYPHYYPERDDGIFVECTLAGIPSLHYLVRKG